MSFMLALSLFCFLFRRLQDSISDVEMECLPRDEECLKYLLRMHLNVAGVDFHSHLKQALSQQIRPLGSSRKPL